MATYDEKMAFIKMWYSEDVKSIEDFREADTAFSGSAAVGKLGSKPVEGQPKTYPAGYTNQSLNQKAQRYINMAIEIDGVKYKHTDKKWREPVEGLVDRDSKGNMVKDSKGMYVGKILKSKNTGSGGKSTAWKEDAFGDWKPGKFTNKG
jgi:hypothetical protein